MRHGILLPWIACLILSHAFADMMKDSSVTFPEQGALPANLDNS